MTTFLVLGGAGIVLVVLSLLLGDVLDGVLHLDALDNDLFSVSTVFGNHEFISLFIYILVIE